MKKLLLVFLFLLLISVSVSAQVTSQTTRRFRKLSAEPATCTTGDVYYNTATSKNRQCLTTNTWSDFGAGSGSGTVTVVSAGSLTSTALVTGGGTTTLQTPSATSTLSSSGVLTVPSQFLGPDGTNNAPSFADVNHANSGMYFLGGGFYTTFSVNGSPYLMVGNGNYAAGPQLRSDGGIGWSTTTDPSAGLQTTLNSPSAGVVAAGTTALNSLGTFVATAYQSATAKVLIKGTGTGATQLAASQTTAPTCSTNCGTSPSVTGTDTFMKVTMGGTGSPASGWVITFNGTWAAAPVCTVQMALAGMLIGKMPLTVVTTTTTITVVTNGTAPANSDVYAVHCGGTQ